MGRIKHGTWGVLILLAATATAAEISVLPSAGKSVGVVTADQPGKWLVMTVDRATFFFSFPTLQLFEGGKVCVWEGVSGVYGVVFDAEDGTRQTTNVVLGGTQTIPPPPPTPVPDGLWGLTKIAYDQSVKLALPADQVKAVAGNYKQIDVQITIGKITTVADAKVALKTANRASVPESDRPLWGQWDSQVTAVLAAHNAELTNSVRIVADAFQSISTGLNLSVDRE